MGLLPDIIYNNIFVKISFIRAISLWFSFPDDRCLYSFPIYYFLIIYLRIDNLKSKSISSESYIVRPHTSAWLSFTWL